MKIEDSADHHIIPCARCSCVGMGLRFKDKYSRGVLFKVTCHDDLCWQGPAKKTLGEAIDAWNGMMGE